MLNMTVEQIALIVSLYFGLKWTGRLLFVLVVRRSLIKNGFSQVGGGMFGKSNANG